MRIRQKNNQDKVSHLSGVFWTIIASIAAVLTLILGVYVYFYPNPNSLFSQPLDKPALRISMFGGNVFIANGAGIQQPLTGIALTAKIWNVGTSSVATNWNLTIMPQNGIPVVAQLIAIPKTLTLTGTYNNVTIFSSDELDTKTGATPVGEIPIQGVLLFYVKLPKSLVQNPTTQWELSVQDIYGKISTTTQLMREWLQR
jgi:hypothetical protein